METKIKSKTFNFIFFVGIALLSTINKIGVFTKPFFGLEYEDSYIYTDAGRSLNYQYDWSYQPLSVNSCVIGSISDCTSNSTYSGHLILFPLLISLGNHFLGYSPYNGLYCNFLLSFILILLVYKVVILVHPFEIMRTYIPLLLLVSTPFINLFNTSGLAETISSIFVLSFIYTFFISLGNQFKLKSHSFWLSLFLLLIAIIIKRENILLIGLAPLSAAVSWIKNKKSRVNGNFLIYIFTTVVILISIHFIIDFTQIENQEGKDIGANTFSIANTLEILPLFLKSFFTIDYFGFTGLFLLIAISALFLGKYNEKLVIISILSLGYLLLYSSHYRSYYQVKYGHISIFETLRYSSNYFPLLCVLLSGITFKIKGIGRYLIVILMMFYLPFCVYLNYTLRGYYYKQEVRVRLEPVYQTLKVINKADLLITDIPILFHLFANDRQIILDANFVTSSVIGSYSESNIYVLKKINDSINERRYPTFNKLLRSCHSSKIKEIAGGYELLKINK